MKRHGNLCEQAFSMDALLAAYHKASKGKHKRRATFEFSRRLGSNLEQLHQELNDGTYRPQPYFSFIIREPKPRRIYAPAFRDLVVQHAINSVVYPIFAPTLLETNFACRPGMGTHQAADYSQRALRACAPGRYTLKLDVRKFYYRIDRTIMRSLLQRKIKDQRMVDVMMFAEQGEPVGVPIGNLMSQLFGMLYLAPLDEFIKRELKVRHYCRYVDDFILFNLTRAQCDEHLARIQNFLAQRLNLELSKYIIAPVTRGVNFVGYRTWRTRRFVRKHSLHTFTRSAKAGRLESVVSILGHARRTWSLRYLTNQLQEHHHALHRQLPQSYRRNPNRGTRAAA